MNEKFQKSLKRQSLTQNETVNQKKGNNIPKKINACD